MMLFLAVCLAGALGAVLRYGVGLLVRSPWAVLVVNVVGSFVGGVVVASASGDARVILLTGLCGGLTTFSTLSVETVQLVLDGRARVAALSVGLNVALGLVAAGVGFGLGTL